MIRFRTQDTKASWARKLNALFASSTLPALNPDFSGLNQTSTQWVTRLNALSKAARTAGYVLDPQVYRLTETRQMQCRKLNVLSAAIDSGIPVGP